MLRYVLNGFLIKINIRIWVSIRHRLREDGDGVPASSGIQ